MKKLEKNLHLNSKNSHDSIKGHIVKSGINNISIIKLCYLQKHLYKLSQIHKYNSLIGQY